MYAVFASSLAPSHIRTKLEQNITMIEHFLQSILEQVQQPKADLEKNLRALLSEMISRLDLVSQEEIERQNLLLLKAQKDIAGLARQIDELQQKLNAPK